ncbi:acyl carrier protein [Nocardia tengchongensis]|uniref:acyl carrier protein n=1 Tax=Nocardia tengchongensis TaxID=2055889 RepID=UPI0036C2A130
MSPDEFIEILETVIAAPEASLTWDTPLVAIEEWDSVNALRVIVFLENRMGTSIDFEAFTSSGTVGELGAVCTGTTAMGGAGK